MANRPLQTIKCVVVGDPDSGKTELLLVYTTGKFPSEEAPTGVNNYAVTVKIDREPFTLELFDTTGQEHCDRQRLVSYPQTDVFIICFSIPHPRSFASVAEKWAPEIRHYCPIPILLLGTKKHLRDDEETKRRLGVRNEEPVREEDGREMAKRIGAVAYCECSAEHGVGVKEAFDEAILATIPGPGPRSAATGWKAGWKKVMSFGRAIRSRLEHKQTQEEHRVQPQREDCNAHSDLPADSLPTETSKLEQDRNQQDQSESRSC